MADMDVIVMGLARRLYEAGTEWCEGSGLDTHPWLQVDAHNAAAIEANQVIPPAAPSEYAALQLEATRDATHSALAMARAAC